tara:strand:- start:1225 stop:1824 length:600 start_codon:yes stop_codon:yes gene_type:complete
MELSIINGSQRRSSQSLKVSNYANNLISNKFHVNTNLIDLESIKLPMWTDHKEDQIEQQHKWKNISTKLINSSGFIFVSPEWNGSSTPQLKNFFLYCKNNELCDKPGYIISVTSSREGGSYPIIDLRTNGYKNTGICYIPEHLIIRGVTHVLNSNDLDNNTDSFIRERMSYGIRKLILYTEALRHVRDNINISKFTYGM